MTLKIYDPWFWSGHCHCIHCWVLSLSCHVHWPTKTGQAIHPSSQPPNMWIDPTRMLGGGDSIWPILKGKERIVASVQKFWRASLRKHEFLAPWLAIFWDATAWHGSPAENSLQTFGFEMNMGNYSLEISGQVNKHTSLSDVFNTWSNVAPALSNSGWTFFPWVLARCTGEYGEYWPVVDIYIGLCLVITT